VLSVQKLIYWSINWMMVFEYWNVQRMIVVLKLKYWKLINKNGT